MGFMRISCQCLDGEHYQTKKLDNNEQLPWSCDQRNCQCQVQSIRSRVQRPCFKLSFVLLPLVVFIFLSLEVNFANLSVVVFHYLLQRSHNQRIITSGKFTRQGNCENCNSKKLLLKQNLALIFVYSKVNTPCFANLWKHCEFLWERHLCWMLYPIYQAKF